MSSETLRKWAEENERIAADLRIIATTDPARKKPALKAARIRARVAKEYRAAADRQFARPQPEDSK